MTHELCGVVVVDKPSGPTSFDVVRRVKGLFKAKRCGHTGTLDPTATGVLPICIGDATKIASFVSDGEKEYDAADVFGAQGGRKATLRAGARGRGGGARGAAGLHRGGDAFVVQAARRGNLRPLLEGYVLANAGARSGAEGRLWRAPARAETDA